MKVPLKFKCPDCGLFFFTEELALLALYAGCPGCGQGLYGGPVAQACAAPHPPDIPYRAPSWTSAMDSWMFNAISR